MQLNVFFEVSVSILLPVPVSRKLLRIGQPEEKGKGKNPCHTKVRGIGGSRLHFMIVAGATLRFGVSVGPNSFSQARLVFGNLFFGASRAVSGWESN